MHCFSVIISQSPADIFMTLYMPRGLLVSHRSAYTLYRVSFSIRASLLNCVYVCVFLCAQGFTLSQYPFVYTFVCLYLSFFVYICIYLFFLPSLSPRLLNWIAISFSWFSFLMKENSLCLMFKIAYFISFKLKNLIYVQWDITYKLFNTISSI